MVWYFIGVYIIKRTLYGRLEIRNFSSRVEKIFHSFAALTREIFFNTQREISFKDMQDNTKPDIKNMIIWNNRDIKIDKNTIFFRTWFSRGVSTIETF